MRPTAYDHLLEDPFDDVPPPNLSGSEMPPWHRGLRDNPLPPGHHKIIKRLRTQAGDRDSGRTWGWNKLLKCDHYSYERESHWIFEEFRFETYGGLGLTKIGLILPGTPSSYSDGFYGNLTLVWTNSYEGGWRDGVWWERLGDLATSLERATVHLAAEHARKVEDEKRAKKNAEDGSYAAYMRKIKGA